MPSHRYHRYYRGIFLQKIAYALGVPQMHHKKVCAELHKAFKEYLMVESTAGFSDHQFLTYMSAILMLMSREMGVVIPFMHEPDNAEEMELQDWFALQEIIDK